MWLTFVICCCYLLIFYIIFSYIILEKLPTEYDSRVKAMEVDEKPQEEYQDIGGMYKNEKNENAVNLYTILDCNYR